MKSIRRVRFQNPDHRTAPGSILLATNPDFCLKYK